LADSLFLDRLCLQLLPEPARSEGHAPPSSTSTPQMIFTTVNQRRAIGNLVAARFRMAMPKSAGNLSKQIARPSR
jgi:hypothetical protein